MILAYLDYRRYKGRTGRYARHSPNSVMGRAFLGGLPDEVVSRLSPGDLIFSSHYDSLVSWAVMYFTSSEVSHTATYLGAGRIVHATLSGIIEEPISTLYGEATRVLPCRIPMEPEQQTQLAAHLSRIVGHPYGWRAVRIKLLRILSGRDVPYFRWKFVVDAAATLAVMDLPFLMWLGHPVLIWFLAVYSVLVLVNRVRWYTDPFPANEDYMKPSDLLRIFSLEGQPFVDGNALNEQRRQQGLPELTPFTSVYCPEGAERTEAGD